MMLLVCLVMIIIHNCVAFDLPRVYCKGNLNIEDRHYNITDTYHTSSDTIPTDAHYDKFGNLFYVESGRNEQGFFFNVKLLEPESATAQSIKGLPKGSSYSIAVDKKDTKVYFGTAEGIFVFDYETLRARRISEKDLKLNMLFVDKDGNKYITESNNGIEELYLLDGNKKIRFHTLEALNELAIDEKNNFYFIRDDKFFVLKSTLSKPVFIGNITYDGIAQISVYKKTIFVASEDLVYLSEHETTLKSVENVPGKVTAVAFNTGGDFILGIQGKILKYKENNCYLRDNVIVGEK